MSSRRGGSPASPSFNLRPGRVIARNYVILSRLGSGWESEVYRVAEKRTGIERAAKLFFPQRNINNRTAKLFAKKLHKLRHCPLIIQYHAEEIIALRKTPITVLISEYVEGVSLAELLARLPGKRLGPFESTHLLYALVRGMEQVHAANEYHGDIHTGNIMVGRYGLTFDIKLLDVFHVEAPKAVNKRYDICDTIRVFHEALGGARCYRGQPPPVKQICCGLRNSLILKRFPSMSRLRRHIETMTW